MTDPFETFDGAYVLGALSSADRQSFDAHLEICDGCLQRVIALRDVPSLLMIAPPSAFSTAASTPPAGLAADETPPPTSTVAPSLNSPPSTALTEQPPVPADLLPTVLTRIRRRRRRRSISRAVAGLAAACILALAGAAAIGLANRHSSGPQVTAQVNGRSSATVTNAFLTAAVSVTTRGTWDEVHLSCTYKSRRVIVGNYIAVAKDATGRTEVVASWPAISGQTAVAHTPTTFKSGTITSVSILNARGQTLVQMTV